MQLELEMEMLSLVINTDSIIPLSIYVTTFLFIDKYQTMFVTVVTQIDRRMIESVLMTSDK